MENGIDWCINEKGYCLFEVFCSTEQIFEPKSATKRLEDGSLYSPPLEDLAPFLSREELKSNMYIKMWDER
jgi:acetolactate synthase-1/2/3 large subunit